LEKKRTKKWAGVEIDALTWTRGRGGGTFCRKKNTGPFKGWRGATTKGSDGGKNR